MCLSRARRGGKERKVGYLSVGRGFGGQKERVTRRESGPTPPAAAGCQGSERCTQHGLDLRGLSVAGKT